jgi:PPM family protein phosphatase
VVADEQIAQIVNDRSAPLEEICGRLIDAANDAGGPDNITAMLLQVDAP